MWMTVLIAGGLFVALLAMLWLNVEDAERRRAAADEGRAAPAGAPSPAQAQCVLCEAPLQPRRTSDEVVIELERRIAADLAEVVGALRGGERGLRPDPGRRA